LKLGAWTLDRGYCGHYSVRFGLDYRGWGRRTQDSPRAIIIIKGNTSFGSLARGSRSAPLALLFELD
jgi:hypothetical protein